MKKIKIRADNAWLGYYIEKTVRSLFVRINILGFALSFGYCLQDLRYGGEHCLKIEAGFWLLDVSRFPFDIHLQIGAALDWRIAMKGGPRIEIGHGEWFEFRVANFYKHWMYGLLNYRRPMGGRSWK